MTDVFTMTYWETEPPETEVELEPIDDFSARGMRRVYSRADQYHGRGTFNMDIWKTRDGRLLLRFWSRCQHVEWWSREVKGMDLSLVPEPVKGEVFQESWIPQAVRLEYDDWVDEEYWD